MRTTYGQSETIAGELSSREVGGDGMQAGEEEDIKCERVC